MNTKQLLMTAAIVTALSTPALAQTGPAYETKRDTKQQNRIEQGLKSGQLNAREAARLEKGEARIDRAETRAMSDGKMSPGEKARIQKMQNHESERIYREKHDNVRGNPDSRASMHMQRDVRRDTRQENRGNGRMERHNTRERR